MRNDHDPTCLKSEQHRRQRRLIRASLTAEWRQSPKDENKYVEKSPVFLWEGDCDTATVSSTVALPPSRVVFAMQLLAQVPRFQGRLEFWIG